MDAAPPVIRIPDPCLVVLVGAAGSGKSTFAARHFAADEILSSDAFRERVSGDPSDQRATRPAFAALHRALHARLGEGRLAVVDATSVERPARAALLAAAAAARVPAVAIILDLPAAVVRARNASRPGPLAVPEPAVRRHLAGVRRLADGGGLAAEGFAATWRIHDPADLDRVRVSRVRRVSRVPGGPRATARPAGRR